MRLPGLSWIQQLKARWIMRKSSGGMSSMTRLSTGGGIPVRQTQLAPQGLEFLEDVSEARWVEESVSEFGKVRALVPDRFPAYARVFHPAYLDTGLPVRWSTVASWTGRAVHPLMQFERIADLSEAPGDIYRRPSMGFVAGAWVDPRTGVPDAGQRAQRVHLDPRRVFLLPLGRLWQYRHPPLQSFISREVSGTRLPALSRLSRCGHVVSEPG